MPQFISPISLISLISLISHHIQDLGVPLVAFSLSPKEDGTKRGYDEFDLAEKLLAYRRVRRDGRDGYG